MDIKVTIKYPSGKESEFVEPINEVLSIDEINKELKINYYEAINIEWHQIDDYLDY